MSSTTTIRIIICSALLVLLIFAGVFVHKTGKPYHALIFGIHKIFTVAMIVILSVVFIPYLRQEDAGIFHHLFLGILLLAIIGLLVSGAMMSLDKFQGTMLVIHRVATAGFLLAYIVLNYMLISDSIQTKSL